MQDTQIHDSRSLFIVGPTASGKSGLAMAVAKELNGEIICADSQTLRIGLDIGTAKPSKEDRESIPHHLLDVIEPYDDFSVTQFQDLALKAIVSITSRGKLPIIVGGTGLYIDSLYFQYELSRDDSQIAYKVQLQSKTIEELQAMIRTFGYPMPHNDSNPRHLIGTLIRKGEVKQNKQPLTGAIIYGVQNEDDILKQRINERVERMFDGGFLNEVTAISEKYGPPPNKLDAIGYPIAFEYIKGNKSLEEVKELFKSAHWQYARRQKSWFRRNPHIKWLNTSKEALQLIKNDLS